MIAYFCSDLPDDLLLINRNIYNNCDNQHQYQRQKYFQYLKKMFKMLFQISRFRGEELPVHDYRYVKTMPQA